MSHERTEGGRPARRAFRPMVDHRLESRALLSRMGAVHTHVAAGGQATVVTNPSGLQFFVSVINGGSVRAFPASGNRVNLVVDGSNADTLLEINQVVPSSSNNKGAHTFNTALQTQFGQLNVASITVTSGMIGSIEGYRDTILSGPIVVAGGGRVDRIAVQSIVPGASIRVGGDLNTLDVLNDANFSNSPGLVVGRDLNSVSVGGNLSFSNGANFSVARDFGLVPQPAKGSGPAGQGLALTGDLAIAPNAGFSVGRRLDGFLVIDGNASGVSRALIGFIPLPTYFGFGFNNILIRGQITA